VTTLGAFRGVVRNALGYLNVIDRPDPDNVFHRANLPRTGDDVAALTSGVMTVVPLWCNAGDPITNLTAISGGTAAVTPTHSWFALYNPAGSALLGQTADQVTAAWAADTVKTLALAAPVKITASGLYLVGIMVAAATVPTLIGASGAKPFLTGEVNLAQNSGSALTTTAPATVASPAFQRQVPLVIAT
jgi:hypothetical protein